MILNNEREKTIYQQGYMSGCNAAQTAIKAAEHRAEVAERALGFICDKAMKNHDIIVFPEDGTQTKNKAELFTYCIERAERELAEE